MPHKWYYDLTDDHRHSGDAESLLVWLCDDCANRLAAEVQPAGTDGFCDAPCWQCDELVERAEEDRP